MFNIGDKIAELRKAKNWSQSDLAKAIEATRDIIGKYERDEMLPSIEAAKKIANFLYTTVGYLLGESTNSNVLKDKLMLNRLNHISLLPKKDKECVLYTIDHLLASVKIQAVYN